MLMGQGLLESLFWVRQVRYPILGGESSYGGELAALLQQTGAAQCQPLPRPSTNQ